MEIKKKTIWGLAVPLASGISGAAIDAGKAVAVNINPQDLQKKLADDVLATSSPVQWTEAPPSLEQPVKLRRKVVAITTNTSGELPVKQLATEPALPITIAQQSPPLVEPSAPALPISPPANLVDPTAPPPPPIVPAVPVAPAPIAPPPAVVQPAAPQPSAPLAPAVAAQDFFYVGGNFGSRNTDDFSLNQSAGNLRLKTYRAASYGAFVGYKTGNFRVEAEVNRAAPYISTVGIGGNSGQVTSASGVLSNNAYMINAYLDVPIDNTWKPFVGVGIGLADIGFSGRASVTNNGQTTNLNLSTARSGFAYQLKAGVAYGLNDKTDLFVQYRYLSTTGGSSGLNQIDDYSSNSIEGGIRVGL